MASTKKSVNKSSDLRRNDLELQLAFYAQQTERLDQAYTALCMEFQEVKQKWETSHQTLKQLINHLSDGLMFVTREGVIDLVNPAACEILMCSREQLAGQPFSTCFSDHFFGFSMSGILENGNTAHQRIFLTLNGEKEIEVSTSTVPGKGLLLLLTNRTEQQQLQKSLNQAERLQELGEMAATLAHEIRNPLGGIEGFAQLLKRDLQEPAHVRMIGAILEGTQTLNHLVTDVLDYAKPLRLHFAETDVVELIQGAVELAKGAAPDIDYVLQTSHTTFYLSIDKEKIQRVILNLLRNACEAGATTIEIVLTQEGKVLVKDNGTGISSQNLQKIFTPFFTTKTRGTGLGLAESLSVIKAHGGQLEVTSQEGLGTQFTLTFSG